MNLNQIILALEIDIIMGDIERRIWDLVNAPHPPGPPSGECLRPPRVTAPATRWSEKRRRV